MVICSKVGQHVSVGDHHAGRRPGRARGVLQIRRGCFSAGMVSSAPDSIGRVQIQEVDLDDGGNVLRRLCLDIPSDVARDCRCGQNDGGLCVAQHRIKRSSVTPPSGTASGTGISPACSAPRKPTTYSRPWGADIKARSPGDAHSSEFAGDVQGSPIQLRPRQAQRDAGPVLVVVDERHAVSSGCKWRAHAAALERMSQLPVSQSTG